MPCGKDSVMWQYHVSLLDVKSLNAVPVFVILSPKFFKTESISSLYQIQFLYKFYNGIFIIVDIFNKIKFI